MVLLESSLDNVETRLGIDGMVIENFITEQVEVLAENLEVNVFPAIMGKSVNVVKMLGGIAAFLAVPDTALFRISSE